MNQDFSTFLVKYLSAHIPGWASKWKLIFEKHKNFNNLVVKSFTNANANECRLSKSASLFGGHKNIESLETAILVDSLIKQQELRSREAVLFYRQTFYSPRLVRCVLQDTELAWQETAFIIELGDTGKLDKIKIRVISFSMITMWNTSDSRRLKKLPCIQMYIFHVM